MNVNKLLPVLFSVIMLMTIVLTSCVKDKVFPIVEEPNIPNPADPTDTTTTIELCDTLSAEFAADVQPIINTNCAYSGCHITGHPNGNFSNYTGLKAKVDAGSFEQRVLVLKNMPASGPLPQAELDVLQCWLDAGAPNN